MANMTFKTNLLPNSTTLEYSLGSTEQKWKINGVEPILTDIAQNITLATTTKAYLTGVNATNTLSTNNPSALEGVADTGVYLTENAGEISAVRHSFNNNGAEKAYITFDSALNALEFAFV